MAKNRLALLLSWAAILGLSACTVGPRVIDEPQTGTTFGALREDQEEFIADLELASGDHIEYRFRSDGTLRYLAGADISPNCRVDAEEPITLGDAEDLVHCFLDDAEPLFKVGEEDAREVAWVITRARALDSDGTNIIRAQQRIGEVPIKGAEFVILTYDGVPISYQGTQFPPSAATIPHTVPSDTAAEAEAELLTGLDLVFLKRTYFPRYEQTLSHFVAAADSDYSVVYFEDSGLVAENPMGIGFNAATINTVVADFDGVWGRAGAGPTATRTLRVDETGTCEYRLDAGSNQMDGLPKTALAENGSKNGSVVEWSGTCGGGLAGFPGTRKGIAASAHYWISDLADFSFHWRAAYSDWYNYDEPENLKVISQETNSCPSASACIWPTVNFTGSVTEWRIILPENNQSFDNLTRMAHEYGHYVAYSYDFYDNWGSAGREILDGAVDEGWADHNVLRYAMYRLREATNRPHDSTFTASHSTHLWNQTAREHVVTSTFHNGEEHPAPNNSSNPQNLFYRPWTILSPCSTNNPNNDRYDCGSIMGAVYWTLAWNEVRASFMNVTAGTEILSPSNIWHSQPERLANVAYTFAINVIPEESDQLDFFDRISERYYRYQRVEGWITGPERHRLNVVLASHCVGWSHRMCSDNHVTAWGRLPVMHTVKQTFANSGNTKEFIRAQSMTPIGGASVLTFADGINDTPQSKYVRLDDSGEGIYTAITIPVSGTYTLSLAANGGSVALAFNGATSQEWTMVHSGWGWSHNGPSVYLPAGTHTVQLRWNDADILIEAILIRRE